MDKKNIKNTNLKDKTIIMRVDFNVPLDEKLNITDDTRIKAALPTIKYILDNGAKRLILMSHLGRPDGKIKEELRLNPVAKRLQELLGEPVDKLDDCIGETIKKQIQASKKRLILLENLRFHAEEEENDQNFAKELAGLAQIYVNDAFGTAHRAHASTEGVAHYLPAVAGFLLEKEINYLGKTLENPAKPFVVILGGAKVSDKIGVIENLLKKANKIIIGGGMAYTFLKAQGKEIGKSKLEKDKIDIARDILKKAEQNKVQILLPIDNVCVKEIKDNAEITLAGENVPPDLIAVDIGPKTVDNFRKALADAKTIVWNGPMGIFEMDKFADGSKQIAEYIANLKATTIIGGGDTAAAVAKFGLEDKMTHISTGGGASLEFLEGKTLPGIAALSDK
ncbi:MAG: phosphoglycerate kinase [Candidatus Omnitrophica bacterium]|nr:phosphoglycerate kinase [Candidatus Omnitrophota bacterium]MDD5352353.1 phosphoglycerate kinase [Candidatus Omnitrophota bacterium]MDD5549951.1 phosphoglycerate kinase [Candidatus Omnitrophota bacterium]